MRTIADFNHIALFSNQSSCWPQQGVYLAEWLHKQGKLLRLFIPEHGFFAEWQDQYKLDSPQYAFLNDDVDIVSLYKSTADSLKPLKENFEDIDALVIDIRDAGARYFTFVTHLYYLLQAVQESNRSITVLVVDRPNAAGNQVEGIMLTEKYGSFLGVPGLPHRYGLSIGELALYFKSKLKADLDLKLVKPENDFWIQPSPNMPTHDTAMVYSGQCLFEATTLSEGRGTTKPFEIFGAPFLSYANLLKIRDKAVSEYPYNHESFLLRPLQFVPAFHKYAGEICNGFQLHIMGQGYHSLLLAMILLRQIQEITGKDVFLTGPYELGSHLSALEILLADDVLIDFVSGNGNIRDIQKYLSDNEKSWIEYCRLLELGESVVSL